MARANPHRTPRIVKVQISLSDGGKQMLVYDRRKNWFYQGPMTAEVKTALGRRKKGYFHATIKGTVIAIGDKAPGQDW